MSELCNKPKVLVFISNYLPGYESGGILRTVVNTVDWLSDDYEFWIVTRDRDLGSEEQYPDINLNEWQSVEGAMVRYLPPQLCTTSYLAKLIADTPHALIHLNSFFDPVFTIRVLLARRLGWVMCKPLVLSVRGELVEGCLRLKYPKKISYIVLSKFLGFYKNVIWHASSKYEALDFVKVLSLKGDRIKVALDLPSKVVLGAPNSALLSDNCLRVVFLSRLTREKNLDYALRILKRVKAKIVFDIYGPAEDPAYLNECQELINKLPQNISANYHGPVSPSRVAEIFSSYDLFFFPSRGENYGHVIAESISVGTKILISNNTPWLDLENEGLGWDLDLKDESGFVNILETLSLEGLDERLEKRALVQASAHRRLLNPEVLNDNRELFRVSKADFSAN